MYRILIVGTWSCVHKWRENLRQRDVPSCEADDGCCSRIFGSA